MKDLRKRFARFCLRNRDKGIPNLMLYIAIGNAIVLIMSQMNNGEFLYQWLRFDKTMILKGQVWRLFTYVFTQSGTSIINLVFLYFFYMLGRQVEMRMGTFKFNLFYLSGVIFMDIFAMIFCPVIPDSPVTMAQAEYLYNVFPIYYQMAMYLHLSLILMFATTYPDSQFMIMFIIPVKAWVMALIYLILEAVAIFNMSYPVMYFPHNLFPLVALGNYFLFTGRDIINVLPPTLRMKLSAPKRQARPKVVQFRGNETRQGDYKPQQAPYNHRCRVCGRTDISNPELEFRYCSRCAGYQCYCEDHINNHEHVE